MSLRSIQLFSHVSRPPAPIFSSPPAPAPAESSVRHIVPLSDNPVASPSPSTRGPLLVCLAGLLLLAAMIALSPAKLCYDEGYHLDLVEAVREKGWQSALASPDYQSAAGPLFPAVQMVGAAFTGLKPPAVRWVNFACLFLAIFFVTKSLGPRTTSAAWLAGFSILAIPFLWPAAGMALTEPPALAAFSAHILCMVALIKNNGDPGSVRSLGLAALAGLALGLAILGRQTYLIVLPAFAALFLLAPRKSVLWAACLVIAGLSSGWIFILWGGLVPPLQKHVNSGMRIDHGVLSLTYVTAATVFLHPSWLKPRNFKVLMTVIALGFLLALITLDYSSPPAKSLLLRVFGQSGGLAIGYGIGAVLVAASMLWLWNTLHAAWLERRDPLRAFLFLVLFALTAAPIKVSHLFSSRYVVGLLGVLILIVGLPPASATSIKWLSARLVMGCLLGASTLWTYYQS